MDGPGDEVRQAERELIAAQRRRRVERGSGRQATIRQMTVGSIRMEASFCAEKGAGREHEETYLRSIYGAI
jgi:hypothetical protein